MNYHYADFEVHVNHGGFPRAFSAEQFGPISDGQGWLSRIYETLRKRSYRLQTKSFARFQDHVCYVQGVRDALNWVYGKGT